MLNVSLMVLVWKNCVRKQMRFVLTSLSVLVAFFLFTMLAGIDHALTASMNNTNEFRLITSHRVSLARSLPLNYQQKISQIAGVNHVAYASWFGGFFQDEKHQLAVSAVSAENYFRLFPEYVIAPEALERWQNNRIGLVIGQAVADKYHWQVGDRIPLKSSIWMTKHGSFTWDFVVSAIYQAKENSTDTNKLFFQHKYFDEARAYARDSATWFSSQINAQVDADEVINAIDILFANTSENTRTTTEQVFAREQAQQFSDMAKIIKWVLLAVFFTLLLIVCNTMILTIQERMNELAVMKAMGCPSILLIRQVFLESLILIGCGATLGTMLATVLTTQIKSQLSQLLPGIQIQAEHYWAVLVFIVLFALLSSIFPALSVSKMRISSTLGARQ